MGVKVFWTDFSKQQLNSIFTYYIDNATLRVAKQLVSGIVKETQQLSAHYEIGQKEELLLERKEDFRYLVFKKYKIIYWFNDVQNRVEVVDVFDTRQYPEKIKRKK